MSLINQMLKDLEKRQGGRIAASDLFSNMAVPGGRSASRWKIYALLIVIILALALTLFWVLKKPATRVVVRPAKVAIKRVAPVAPPATPAPAIVKPIAPATAAPAPTLSVLIHAVAVTGDNTNTRLSVYLNKPVHYIISSDPAKNSLTLTLDNAQLAEPLLPQNTQNTLIKNLQVNTDNNKLQINMQVDSTAQIAQLKLDHTDTDVLILDLTSQNNNSTAGVLNNVATINPDNLTSEVLDKTSLDTKENDTQSYIEKIPQPLTPEQQAEHDYQNALNLLQSNEWPAAATTLKAILARTPDYTPARTALITLLLKQNHLLDAQQVVQDGLALQPQQSDLIKLAAQILLAQGQPASALKLLKSSAPALVADPDYYALMAALYQRQGYALKAAQIYDQLISLNNNNAIWWLGLATSLETAGKNKAALEAYQNANIAGNLSPQLQAYVNTRIHALGE